jgi:hypothetical protein
MHIGVTASTGVGGLLGINTWAPSHCAPIDVDDAIGFLLPAKVFLDFFPSSGAQRGAKLRFVDQCLHGCGKPADNRRCINGRNKDATALIEIIFRPPPRQRRRPECRLPSPPARLRRRTRKCWEVVRLWRIERIGHIRAGASNPEKKFCRLG